ncbi:hypothetical protein [Pedobacter sp.]|uniref:hypothetical protein n=1 Tax=Pedobacter sp. TaxID=1411316 RepID=UPI00396CA3A6
MKRIFLFLIGFFTNALLHAQSKTPYAIASPNAAGLGLYGQIPVSYFNGLPNIGIPLHVITEKELTLPIDLSYHASGVRPDHHPGWVGLGWSLSAGGTITRKVNGEPDEMKDPVGNTDRKSYLINYGALNRSDWDLVTTLRDIMDKNTDVNPLEGGVNPAPDEFMFNFMGYSGSFFLDHTGTWRVRSSNGKAIKVTLTTNSFELNTSSTGTPIMLSRIIDKIVLTAPDGVVYTFGGTNESIEFSRNAGERDETYRQVVPTSWYLTKVSMNTGEEILLNYEREGYVVINTDSWSASYINDGNGFSKLSGGAGGYIAENLINPVYLKEIISSSQTIVFDRVQTNELQFPRPDGDAFTDSSHPSIYYQDVGTGKAKWYKLTTLHIYDNFNNKEISRFNFTYKDVPTSRLMLLSVQEENPETAVSKNPYNFHYYDNPYFELPDYISRKLDHWGFFNNKSYFEGKPGNYKYTPDDEAAYKTSRESDPYYMQEGTLSHIQYPTGGRTEFIYEPNTYSYIANSYNSDPYFKVDKLGNSGEKKIGGGLRIKKIISKTGTSPDEVREFFYDEGDTYNTSSGILGGEHGYVEKYYHPSSNCSNFLNSISIGQNIIYWLFTNYSVTPLSFTGGNHITYSRVKEKFTDGSYKIYEYSNHNNPIYRNVAANNGTYVDMASRINVAFTDMAYSRGKLLSETTYDSSNKLLQQITREYNNNPARFNEAIRATDITQAIVDGHSYGKQIIAYKHYLFEPYLTKVTTKNYDQKSDNYVSQAIEYTYDDSTLLLKKERISQSDGKQLITYFKYPKDKDSLSSTYSTTNLSIVDEMVNKHIIIPILEKEFYRDTTFLKRESTVYDKYVFDLNTFYKPSLIKSRFNGQVNDELEMQYHYYDSLGNLLSYSEKKSFKTSLAWGYNKTLPIAKVNNADNNEFFFNDFEQDISLPKGNAHTGVRSRNNGAYEIPFVRPNSRAYKVSYFRYVSDQWQQVVKDYVIDHFTINESAPIDDVTVYPADATIQTYTYMPLIGMTSETAINHNAIFYEYDSLNRLSLVKDNNGRVVKAYTYNYANTVASWVNTGNINCETTKDAEFDNQLAYTGNISVEQRDTNPNSFTYNQTRKIAGNNQPATCPPNLYYKEYVDPYFYNITIRARRSYDDSTTKIMKFRIRYDTFNNTIEEKFVEITVSGSRDDIFEEVMYIGAASYYELELVEIR